MQKLLILIGSLFIFTACSTPFNSGISGDTPVNGISGEDETALCTAMETEAEAQGVTEASKKFACYLGGQLSAAFAMDGDASFEETCQESYDSCMSEEAEESEDAGCELNFGDCAAPLADYEACTLANWDEMKTMADEMSCKEEEGDDTDDTADADTCANPEACKAFYDACPELDPCTATE
ncbi:MAG: hypothetical protein CMH56_10985 [Myxococcales bacterium]|nr:hypothetical protein [Myxococcales bacterium]|tara:strand:+ start:4035 stop:4577 length:543 start_codon:yes stop_codon:yes gene_type:complete